MTQPNLIFVFADQWRAQAFGYAGDPNVKTPHIDAFAAANLNFTNAVSGCPVCTPYRGCLMTGQYPYKNGLVVNDQCLYERATGPFLAEAFADAGYHTAYIGKWHIDGRGRSAYIPPERRLGWQFWRGHECSHDYNNSTYYADDDPTPRTWPGYDAISQTQEAIRFLAEERDDRPFAMALSWGPPHDPYHTAPQRYRDLYDPATITLRPNVPPEAAEKSAKDLAGYYAHCTALDDCFATLLQALDDQDLAQNTILIFCSDHGDMLGSRGMTHKQRPWAESLRVPFIIRDPRHPGARQTAAPIDAPDIMPTLLGLCDIPIPDSVQGLDFSPLIRGTGPAPTQAAYLSLCATFHQWGPHNGGRPYRGLHTDQYTYVRDQDGPWLLYDNQADPYQTTNLIGDPTHAQLISQLDTQVQDRITALNDPITTTQETLANYNIRLNERGDVAYDK